MPNQAINVEWTTPDEVNGKITNYIVHYGEVPEGNFFSLSEVLFATNCICHRSDRTRRMETGAR